MRKILTLTLTFILIYQGVSGQGTKTEDTLNIRILNKGKHYIKEYTLTIDSKNYTYKDIWKNKYSDYQQLLYIWTSNRTKTIVIIKMLGYDKWMNTEQIPNDYIGETKLTTGYYTIEIRTRKKKDNLEVEDVLIKDNHTN